MKEVQLFRKILFPTDFSDESINTLEYVVRLSTMNQSELLILYTFRLIGTDDDTKKLVDAKRMLEDNARQAFEKIDNALLRHSSLSYTFLSEVGFISDRIMSNIKEHDVDLLILYDKMHDKIDEKLESGSSSLMSQISCPVMFVPERFYA